jgi:phosphoribosylformylglycinamidine cyclo-ligase
LQRDAWARDPVFDWLQQTGRIADEEMYRTFNCGIGMVVIVSASDAPAALELLSAQGETATIIGAVTAGDGEVSIR